MSKLFRAITAAILALQFASSARAEIMAECALEPHEIYAQASPAVVQVVSISIDPFLVMGRVMPRFGTGFVFGSGYIVTNYHVVADAQRTTVFIGDDAFSTTVLAIDPTLDVAVLWAPEFGPSLEFADTTHLEIGREAYVIGFPLGLGKTITSGLISGVSRVLPRTTSSWLSPYIQTDAAVSPGNSGGPLLDSCGRVMGMITASIWQFGAENIGFAIPANVLKPIITELVEDGYVSRPWHGLYGQMTSPAIIQAMGLSVMDWFEEGPGFLIETIEPGSAADRAGLRGGVLPMMWDGAEVLIGGDIITHVDGQRIDSLDAALEAVNSLTIGETIELVLQREGTTLTKSVLIEERPILERELEVFRYPQ